MLQKISPSQSFFEYLEIKLQISYVFEQIRLIESKFYGYVMSRHRQRKHKNKTLAMDAASNSVGLMTGYVTSVGQYWNDSLTVRQRGFNCPHNTASNEIGLISKLLLFQVTTTACNYKKPLSAQPVTGRDMNWESPRSTYRVDVGTVDSYAVALHEIYFSELQEL